MAEGAGCISRRVVLLFIIIREMWVAVSCWVVWVSWLAVVWVIRFRLWILPGFSVKAAHTDECSCSSKDLWGSV